MSKVIWIMHLRPLVSARYPHKCDEQIIPQYTAPAKIPFCADVKFKSHATGITYAKTDVSHASAYSAIPPTRINT